MRWTVLLHLFLLLTAVIAPPALAQDDGDIMVTDGVQHSVPLNEIIFDTFGMGGLPYDEATPAEIESLRDRIRPFCHDGLAACLPISYESVEAANEWLSGGSLVLGYTAPDGQSYAYPFKILNYHEIVNETFAGQAVLVSYCPLCNSAIVYDRTLDGEPLLFGNTSALYESDMVMYDVETDSYWFQVGGRAILGELTNRQLEPLPSVVAPWRDWQTAHPDTLVLARPNTGVDYTQDPFSGYASFLNSQGRFAFPVSEEVAGDDRLPPATNVLLIELGGDAVAYPVDQLADRTISDTVGGTDIVVLRQGDFPATVAAAYLPQTEDGTPVDLSYDADAGVWVDAATEATFDVNGRGLTGELAGAQLERIPTRFTFWFAAVASTPGVTVFAS